MKILVADVPHMDVRHSSAFAGWEVAYARTMAEARQALAAARPDVMVIGVYFDDSQMFDLVRTIREDAKLASMPVFCVRGSPGFTAVTRGTLEVALKALGVNGFVDLTYFGNEDAGNAALRASVGELASGPARALE